MLSPQQGMMQARTSRRQDTGTVKGIAVKVKMDKFPEEKTYIFCGII